MKKLQYMKRVMLMSLTLVLSYLAYGQQTNEKFVTDIDYLLYIPAGYHNDTIKQWPLLMFLHGSGEQGSNLEKVKTHGPPMLIEQGQNFPFVVVSPQARQGWSNEMLYKLLQNIISTKRIDPDRIYLTGLSMGGFGTWKLAIDHPEVFAAIAPVCGGGNNDDIWKLRHMPVWCFHGAEDSIVPLRSSEEMIHALKKYNQDVIFTVYPSVGHDSWVNAYNDPRLYEWFLQQKKHQYKKANVDSTIYKKYTGEHLLIDNQSETIFKIVIKDNKLIAQVNNGDYELKPVSETRFFVDENLPIELHFMHNSNGTVDRIVLYDEKITEIKKLKED